MTTVITAHTDHAGLVHGVHGGSGRMSWLRAATGSHLYGDWDGVEWVAFEPGGGAGLHTHSHTEELWFILRGTGNIELNGDRHAVEPGSIVLTPLHSNHAARNTGDVPLEYVVIEVFPPVIRDQLPPRRPTDEAIELGRHTTSFADDESPGRTVFGGLVAKMEPDTRIDARPYLDGDWESFARTSISPGTATTFGADDREFAVFVMSGTGTMTVGGSAQPYRTGSVITVGASAMASLAAESDSELFVTTVRVRR